MKKSFFALCFVFWSAVVSAGVPCTVPFNLQNNTIADATQVMANYNALIACLANAAAAGSNNDITALLGLSTPLGPTFGGTSKFTGGTSTGVNTVAVTVTPSSFSLTTGYQVSFTLGGANNAATTLNVNGTGAIPVFRPTQFGTSPFIGGEWVTTQRVLVEYDGTQWQWQVPPIRVGAVYDFASTTCPTGTFPTNNQTFLRTTDLFTAIGTTWGIGNGSTTANFPDLRNRATYGQDQNVGGFSNRITVAGNNFDGTVVGNAGGLQNSTALIAHNHGITDPGHVHLQQSTTMLLVVGATANVGGATTLSTGGTTQSATTGITVNNAGAGTSYSVLAPAAIVSKCIQG